LHTYLFRISDFSDLLKHISQGSVATLSKSGGIFTNHFIANCPLSVRVKEF